MISALATFQAPATPAPHMLEPAFNDSDWFRQDNDPVQRDRALIEADLVDCMVALPGQLFSSTQIPVCLRFLAKTKTPPPNAASESTD